jgi:hypothetical protein
VLSRNKGDCSNLESSCPRISKIVYLLPVGAPQCWKSYQKDEREQASR